MPKLRTSLSLLVWIAGSTLSLSYGCSGADDPPPDTVNPSGGSGGTGNDGQIIVDAPPGYPDCADPNNAVDSDGDSIADDLERDVDGNDIDSDGDGKPDWDDTDSDNDGFSDAEEAGPNRPSLCYLPNDADGDRQFDFQDADSDADGLPDKLEQTCGSKLCRLIKDCDDDGVLDLVETAAGGDSCDGVAPPNAELYFVVPYLEGPQKKKFKFSAGLKEADIYFMIDSTVSMQPAIDNIKSSLNSKIIPKILNGDPAANPPIKPIPGAHIGIGTFRDVPWAPWGVPGDDIYSFFFTVNAQKVYGNVTAPQQGMGGNLVAPSNVETILNSLTAAGGGDAPESLTQALWLASTNNDYRATAGGLWPPNPPTGNFDAAAWRQNCGGSNFIGRACFRPGKLPVFAIITDAGFHNGASGAFDYVAPPTFPPSGLPVGGTKTYTEVVNTMNAISAKVIGVSVNTGSPGQARNDLRDLAEKTNSLYQGTGFDTALKPLVTEMDTTSGNVSDEVVKLLGLLTGQGVNNVTTDTTNYSCPGNVDCDGDGLPDSKYDNPPWPELAGVPYDASELIVSVTPVKSTAVPLPYKSVDSTTFYGILGDTEVEFEVTADNTKVSPGEVLVFQAILQVQTPTGQALGGPAGIKHIYLVVPPPQVK